ncbi:DNA-binding protein [Granulibacter bethesdensis]|uniref:DNA-binding protein n=3 Tax=Granulibacter bethesdensis TaxID=364410 RepID=Q0BUG7_GRABC|nr:DNA-binding protein [Granulibacter bethesdensis CGDNIH1]AHJ62420.1 DNA-binding protein [Granulibacter bethesdensis]AHJ65044.1 DNA-binding protein [Granulibacter bethesdensis CGDNIH4]APH51333.1 DNA-binding protein [Granulibacter bethesdensis]APH58955.1 DNA-binding protein [Granulibacter bethesdensis]
MAGKMLDWAAYRGQLGGELGKLAKVNPDVLKGHDILAAAAPSPNVLDAKTRELIALAVAVTTRCDGCLAFHTEAARKAGATKEEVAEALGVAIALNTGAALVYSARAMDAFGDQSAD